MHLHILFRIFIAKKSAIKLYRHIIFIKPSISKKTPGSFTDLTRFYLIKQLVSVCCRFFYSISYPAWLQGQIVLDHIRPYEYPLKKELFIKTQKNIQRLEAYKACQLPEHSVHKYDNSLFKKDKSKIYFSTAMTLKLYHGS